MTQKSMKPQQDRPSQTVYGVYGLTEWQALIPAGKAVVRVSFTGGSASGFGIVPATFSTESPVIKSLIERSHYFRNGKIRKLR